MYVSDLAEECPFRVAQSIGIDTIMEYTRNEGYYLADDQTKYKPGTFAVSASHQAQLLQYTEVIREIPPAKPGGRNRIQLGYKSEGSDSYGTPQYLMRPPADLSEWMEKGGFEKLITWKRFENLTRLTLWWVPIEEKPLEEVIKPITRAWSGCCGCFAYPGPIHSHVAVVFSAKEPANKDQTYHICSHGPWNLWIQVPTEDFTVHRKSNLPVSEPEPKKVEAA